MRNTNIILERKMLAVLTIVQALQCAVAMFFHEPSSVTIQALEPENYTDFGFTMAYRNTSNILVVGAPRESQIGKVYTCEMNAAGFTEKIDCEESFIDFRTSEFNTDKFPNQHFYMGSSIAAASDYFFTCAPLWTTNVNVYVENGKKAIVGDAFGTCFVRNEMGTSRYQGLLEQFLKSSSPSQKSGGKRKRHDLTIKKITGGTGWSTLLDEENDLLLIAKTSLQGDFLYVKVSDPVADVKSLNDRKEFGMELWKDYWNIGFGIVSGKFFSKQTVYAFSMEKKNMGGVIGFLEYSRRLFRLQVILNKNGKVLLLTNQAVGAMFGTTMSAADLNMDGLDELLVGAPTQSEDDCFECGALHIYLSGDMHTINEPKRLRTILGSAVFGRFGTAIVAKDIDGDRIPELIVSAPYENNGQGAVYILSGYEVYHTLVKLQDHKTIQLSDLKMMQRIQKEFYRALGFSLQFIGDTDYNGCNELAASSPGTGKVLLFKCVQRINVTLSTELIGEQMVREQDTNFTIQVCARVQLYDLPENIVGNLTVVNSINSNVAIIKQPNIVINISCFNCPRDIKNLCKNVTVELKDKEPAYYTFKSKAELQNNYLSNIKVTDFNNTWVVASPYSKMDTSLEVSRHCKGDDCLIKLSMELLWSGSEMSYLLGSSTNETVTIKVRNDGNASYAACVWVRVSGAPHLVKCKGSNEEGYSCSLQSPLKRDTEETIDLMLYMTKPTNVIKQLMVNVTLYENCNEKNKNSSKSLTIPLNLTADGIIVDGDSHKLNITDKQIMENATVNDHHEYVIKNNGSITWEKVQFIISLDWKPYIHSFNISTMDFGECKKEIISNLKFIHNCTLDLLPNTTQTIIGTTEIFAGLLKGFKPGEKLNMISMSRLALDSSLPVLYNMSTTTITIQNEMTLSSNKLQIILIATFVALIILAIVTLILYKCGFFRRKQQQKLLVMKESVQRKSDRRNTHASAMDGQAEGLQMEIDEDSPFDEPRPVTTKDNVSLVDDKA